MAGWNGCFPATQVTNPPESPQEQVSWWLYKKVLSNPRYSRWQIHESILGSEALPQYYWTECSFVVICCVFCLLRLVLGGGGRGGGFIKTRSLLVALAVLEITLLTRLASNSQRFTCLCLQSAEIKGVLTTPSMLLLLLFYVYGCFAYMYSLHHMCAWCWKI